MRGTFGLGSGLSFGTGAQRTIVEHSPVFLDAGVRTWSDPAAAEVAFALGLRVEIDGRASVGGTVRAEYTHLLGAQTQISVFAGALLYVAPFTLGGPELGTTFRYFLWEKVALTGSLLLDGFILGSDLPSHAALVQLNGVFGVELAL